MNLTSPVKIFLKYLFVFVAALFIARLTIVLTTFNIVVTDNDQVLFWQACDDFSRGIFYTPFIYGCNYGSMLESFIAVPFYKMGMPLYLTLPFSNAFWLSLLCLVLGFKLNQPYPNRHLGSLFIVLLSLLPTECYAILLAPKGHMAGIFLALVDLILITRSNTKFLLVVTGVLAGLAFQLNPNSVFLLILLFLFITNLKRTIYLVTGTAISLIYVFITAYFSRTFDSEYLHKQWKLTFESSFFLDHIGYVDRYLNTVTPLFNKMGFISVLLPVILAIFLFMKKERFKGLIAVLFAIMLVLSFGFSKVSDGSVDVFFPYSRFYLAIAFCNALLIPMFLIYVQKHKLGLRKFFPYLLILLTLADIYFLIKTPEQAIHLVNKQGETYAVQRKFVSEIVEHTEWMKQRLNESKQTKPLIIATDYIYYSENLFLSTMHLHGVISCFENYKKFYWHTEKVESIAEADVLIILNFEDRLGRKMKEYPQYFNKGKPASYFLVRNVNQPAQFINEFLK